MEAFKTHTGVAAPLHQSNVDTDQIIPAAFLKRITKTGFEDALFSRWRNDPDFVLNQEPYKKSSILVTGPDFGTGSSREHAVWALKDYGFKVVLSSRFGDIFRGNAGKQGLVAAVISEEAIEKIWAQLDADPGMSLTVSLEDQTVSFDPEKNIDPIPLEIDEYTRWRLMEGLDDVALTLQKTDMIENYENTRPAYKPQTLPSKVS